MPATDLIVHFAIRYGESELYRTLVERFRANGGARS